MYECLKHQACHRHSGPQSGSAGFLKVSIGLGGPRRDGRDATRQDETGRDGTDGQTGHDGKDRTDGRDTTGRDRTGRDGRADERDAAGRTSGTRRDGRAGRDRKDVTDGTGEFVHALFDRVMIEV